MPGRHEMNGSALDRALVPDPLGMHDIAGMTVAQHHALCLGMLAQCYRHVPAHLKRAILEGAEAAKLMGAPIEPNNLKRAGLPLAMNQ